MIRSFSQLKVAKEAASVPVAATQPSYNKNSQDINEWDQPLRTPSPQLAAPVAPVQQSNASSPYVTDYGAEAEDGSGFEDCKLFNILTSKKVLNFLIYSKLHTNV